VAAASGIRISNAFVLAATSDSSLPAGSQAGLFLGLFNSGDSSDQLVKVTTSAATSVSISGDSVALPPNEGANLTGPQPEIVLNGLTQPLAGGQDINVTFDFSNAGEINLDIPVEPQSFSYSDLSQPPSATPTP
jgi:copper(I)-binding protein